MPLNAPAHNMFHDLKKIEFIGALSGIASLWMSILGDKDLAYITIARESTLVVCLLILAWVTQKESIKEAKEKIEQKHSYENKLIEQKSENNKLLQKKEETISNLHSELTWWGGSFKNLNDSFLNFAIWNHDVTHCLRDSLCNLSTIFSRYWNEIEEYKLNNIEQLEIKEDSPELITLAREYLDGLFEGRIHLEDKEAIKISQSCGSWIDNHAKNISDKGKSSVVSLRKEVISEVCNSTKNIIECLKQTLDTRLEQSFPNENHTASIALKAFINPTKKQHVSVNELSVLTFLRNQATEQRKDRKSVVGKFWSIRGNTAFRRCFEGETRKEWSYIENKLHTLHDAGHYDNERPEFWKLYNSCIVVPLQDCAVASEETQDIFLYGFLAVDVANKDEKEIFNKEEHLNLVSMAADAISTLLHNVDYHFPDLFHEEDFR